MDELVMVRESVHLGPFQTKIIVGQGCSRRGSPNQTHVSGGETGEAAGEIEPGWVGPLVSRKCSGSERASPGLP